MKPTVFIDGEAGTTGLQIRSRLAGRSDLEIVSIDPARRKDPAARAEMLNSADAVVLCLPDDAAREAVSLISRREVKVVDASTAYRVDPDWTFGFPELDRDQRERIAGAARVSNPGCWPTGFIALVRPLVEAGLVPADWPFGVHGVTGYSGGGRTLIEEFEQQPPPQGTGDIHRLYGLAMGHKHVPEMQKYARTAHPPLFSPSVGRFPQGMLVEVPLPLWALPRRASPAALLEALSAYYEGERFVQVASAAECAELQKAKTGAAGYVQALDPESLKNTNLLRLFAFGNEAAGQVRLVAIYDNLGKGASGAAVQNLNLMLGLEEAAGL